MIRRVPIGGGFDLLPVADLAGVAPLAHEDVLLFKSLGAELEVVLHAHHIAFPQHLKTKNFKISKGCKDGTQTLTISKCITHPADWNSIVYVSLHDLLLVECPKQLFDG